MTLRDNYLSYVRTQHIPNNLKVRKTQKTQNFPLLSPREFKNKIISQQPKSYRNNSFSIRTHWKNTSNMKLASFVEKHPVILQQKVLMINNETNTSLNEKT